jgi:hypothetical protein
MESSYWVVGVVQKVGKREHTGGFCARCKDERKWTMRYANMYLSFIDNSRPAARRIKYIFIPSPKSESCASGKSGKRGRESDELAQ